MKFEICNFIHGSENKNISDVTIYQKLAKYLNDKYNKTVRLHKNINDSINCEILLKSMTLGDVLTNKLKFRSVKNWSLYEKDFKDEIYFDS